MKTFANLELFLQAAWQETLDAMKELSCPANFIAAIEVECIGKMLPFTRGDKAVPPPVKECGQLLGMLETKINLLKANDDQWNQTAKMVECRLILRLLVRIVKEVEGCENEADKIVSRLRWLESECQDSGETIEAQAAIATCLANFFNLNHFVSQVA